MIILRDITLRRGEHLLFANSSATLQGGQRIALIGANGSGKSSLFSLLLGKLGADAGHIDGIEGLRIAHMAQEVETSDATAADYVLQGDAAIASLLQRLKEQEASDDFEGLAATHVALQENDGYSAEARSHRLLSGLGFAPGDAVRPVSEFSGGWRIRLNLARALMTPSDVLLLDEPTNHLDMDASLWLQRWLEEYPGTLLLISHDRDFIDATCERVLHIEQQQLNSYRGGYTDFEQLRALRLAEQQALHEKQQRRVAEIEDFVRRFRYQATKARQAQSRLKELERMQQVSAAHVDNPFTFSFPEAPALSDPAIYLEAASLGYGREPLLNNINLRLHPTARIGLLGRNGAGKTTLLKSLVGDLPLVAGKRHVSPGCRVGYYDQQQLEVLDLSATAAQHLQRLSPDAREQTIYDFLGGFDFRGARAEEVIAPFSGGEKARLALAMVVWQKPNLLVLDEPTNHLDLEMRHALTLALQAFGGAVLLVTHDRHLLRNTADELWLIADGTVQVYDGDVASYERTIAAESPGESRRPAPAAPAPAAGSSGDARSRRQNAAARREQLKPLRETLRSIEKDMARSETEMQALQARLADPSLYEDDQQEELPVLLKREGELRQLTESLEERWLETQEALDSLSA
ncbi:MAG: ABC-F family ATP-binding cassette domain-containing protein [Chromatocurvus sp.]